MEANFTLLSSATFLTLLSTDSSRSTDSAPALDECRPVISWAYDIDIKSEVHFTKQLLAYCCNHKPARAQRKAATKKIRDVIIVQWEIELGKFGLIQFMNNGALVIFKSNPIVWRIRMDRRDILKFSSRGNWKLILGSEIFAPPGLQHSTSGSWQQQVQLRKPKTSPYSRFFFRYFLCSCTKAAVLLWLRSEKSRFNLWIGF